MVQSVTTGSRIARLRLPVMIATGMVMFVFISMHLLNAALGLISVQVMEDWREPLSGVWASFLPLKILLQLSLIVHFLVALVSLYYRNTLRIPAYDMAQLVAGVMVIPLLAPHVFGIMAVKSLGLEPTYALVLGQFWVISPGLGLIQIIMLVVAWIHGAIGIFTWLQARDGSPRLMPFFYPFVVALPILAMLGYVEAGRQIIPVVEGGEAFVLENDPNANAPPLDPERVARTLDRVNDQTEIATRISLGLVALVMLARWVRLWRRGHSSVQVTYTGVRQVNFNASTGQTLLEMARAENVPHANVCRGRGRCGTCRVRVLSGAETLPPPSDTEARVLARWNAGPDERLACQVQPQAGALEVERVIQPDYSNLDYGDLKGPANSPAGVTG